MQTKESEGCKAEDGHFEALSGVVESINDVKADAGSWEL
jgi:hypothetical protein